MALNFSHNGWGSEGSQPLNHLFFKGDAKCWILNRLPRLEVAYSSLSKGSVTWKMGYRGTTESNMLSCFESNTFQGRRESLESQQTLPKATVKSQKCAFLGKQKSPQRLRKYTHWSHTQDKLLKKGQGLEANSIPGRQNSQNVSFKFQQKKPISLLLAAGKHKNRWKIITFCCQKQSWLSLIRPPIMSPTAIKSADWAHLHHCVSGCPCSDATWWWDLA